MNSPDTLLAEDLPDFQSSVLEKPGLAQFYAQEQYGGIPAKGLEAGLYTAADLANKGLSLETLGSVSLGERVKATFYGGDNGSGSWCIAEENIPSFRAPEAPAAMQSLRIELKAAAENLLSEKLPVQYYVSGPNACQDSSQLYVQSAPGQFNEGNASVEATEERLSALTDGKKQTVNLFFRKSDQQAGKCLVLVYDLGGLCEVDRLSYIGEYGPYRVGGLRLYAAADMDVLFEDASRMDSLNDADLEISGLFSEKLRYVRARYVAFVFTRDVTREQITAGRQYNMARVREFQAFGRVSAAALTNLLADALPRQYYVSQSGASADASRLYEAASPGQFNVSNKPVEATEERLLTLTDGQTAVVNLFYRASDQQDGKCLVLLYDLGAVCQIHQILFSGESGSYRVGAIRFYVGNTLDSLFDDENRVDTFGDGELDSTGTARQTFSMRHARFVAFVITKDVIQTQIDLGRQYNMARVKEFEVTGYSEL